MKGLFTVATAVFFLACITEAQFLDLRYSQQYADALRFEFGYFNENILEGAVLFRFDEWNLSDPSGKAGSGSGHLKGAAAPIPEVPLYGAFGAIALVGIILVRKYREHRNRHTR